MPDENTEATTPEDGMSQSVDEVVSQEGEGEPSGESPDESSQHPAVQAKLKELAAKEAQLEQAGVNFELVTRVANSPEFDTFMTLLEQGRMGEVQALLNSQSSEGKVDPATEDEDDDTPAWARKLIGRLDAVENVVRDRGVQEARERVKAFKDQHNVSQDELGKMQPLVQRGMSLDEALNAVRAPSLAQKNRELEQDIAKLRENGRQAGTVEGGDSPANEGDRQPVRRLTMEESISSALSEHGHS